MPDRFGGIPLEGGRTDRFGGVPVETPQEPPPVPARVPFGAAPEVSGPMFPQMAATPQEFGEQITTLADPFLQGLTLGAGDEITAAAIAATSDKTFDEALAEVRERSAEIRERLGTGGTVAEVAGGLTLASRLGPMTATPVIARTLPELGRAALAGGAIGAATGGVSGFLTGEGEGRLASAAEGAAVGGTIGVVLPVVASAAAQSLQGVISRFVPGTAQRRAAERLQQALARDEITPDEAANQLRSLGVNATVADIGGENITGLARATQSIPGAGRNIGRQVLETRQQGQTNRVADIVNRAFNRTQSFRQSADDLIAQRSAASTPLYERAYAQDFQFTPELDELFQRPAIQEAWRRAQTIAANKGITLPRIFIRDAQGNLTRNTRIVPNVQAIDFIKRGLDDIVETSRDQLTGKIVGDVARGVNGARARLLTLMDDLVPDYAAARKAFAGPSALRDALSQGRRLGLALNRRGAEQFDVDQIFSDLDKMTDSEKSFFRQGLAQGLIDIIEATPDSADAVKRLVGTEIRRGRLRAVFPDNETFDRFMFDLAREERFFQTRAEVLQNSITARLAQEQADLISGAPTDSAFGQLVRGRPLAALGQAVTAARTPNQATLAELGRLLFSQGPQAEAALVNALRTPAIPPALQRASQAALIEAARQSEQ